MNKKAIRDASIIDLFTARRAQNTVYNVNFEIRQSLGAYDRSGIVDKDVPNLSSIRREVMRGDRSPWHIVGDVTITNKNTGIIAKFRGDDLFPNYDIVLP